MPPKFEPDIQQILLKNKAQTSKITCLRGYHPLRRDYSKSTSIYTRGLLQLVLTTPHLPHITTRNSVCSTSVSLAVTNDIAYCFLFLHLLRCFSSVGSRSLRIILQKRIGSPIRQSWVQRMYAPRPSLSQLTTTLIGNSSQAIPQIV